MALKFWLILGIVLTSWLSLTLGTASVSPVQGILDFLNGDVSVASLVIVEVRLPRTLLSLLCGAALGLAGAALQGLLRNPLADPGLVGASQGAAVGAALVFYYGLGSVAASFWVPAAGLIGAGIALGAVLFMAGSSRPILLILAGLAVSTVAGSLLAVILNFAPNPYAMQELVFWLLGSVKGRSLDYALLMLVGLAIGLLVLLPQRRFLYSLSLGEEVAQSIGFDITRSSRAIILGSAVLVGSAVSVAGNIGFVGLIVPHLIRPLVKQRPDKLLIPSMLAGALLVCLADVLLRLLPPERELKLGVVTSLIGAPLFIWLIAKERRRWI